MESTHSSVTPELKSNIKLPSDWTRESPVKTRTELQENRRRGRMPDSTFDLDGDGVVNGADLVIAKIFDKDQDGKLNQQERQAALQALKEGFLDKFIWGVEAQSSNRAYRILQKRGVIVDQDDFSAVTSTYPKIAQNQPIHKTLSDLKDSRKQDNINNAMQYQNKLLQYAHRVPYQHVISEYQNKNPRYTSVNQIKAEESALRRRQAGLKPSNDIKVTDKDPSLQYIKTPQVQSKSELLESRRRDIVSYRQLSQLQAKSNFSHKGADQRIVEREESYVKIVPEGRDGKTYSKLKEEQRQRVNEYNMRTFSNVAVGIHGGKELPKFSENCPEYWKTEQRRITKAQSQSVFSRKNRYTDGMFQIRDRGHNFLREKSQATAPKPNQIMHNPNYQMQDPSQYQQITAPQKPKRWTDLVIKFQLSARGMGINLNNPPNHSPKSISPPRTRNTSELDANSQMGRSRTTLPELQRPHAQSRSPLRPKQNGLRTAAFQ